MHWAEVIYIGDSVRVEFFEKDEQQDAILILEGAFNQKPRGSCKLKAAQHFVVLELDEAVGYAYSS